MPVEKCLFGLCFFPLESSGQKFFGFSEFLAGLALMVLAWTIADVRYRFRVRTAPIPLQTITYSVVAALGVLTLMTDLWRAGQWLVPRGNLLTPASWQALLGLVFLITFLTWAWFAFIRPPIYGKRNAKRFARTLYQYVLKGSPEELAVISDEIAASAGALVRHATDMDEMKKIRAKHETNNQQKRPDVEAYANDLLLLIADKRLCRAMVKSSPGAALAIFKAIGEQQKYGIQVGIFARNLLNEALANRDSFIFHEADGYESGLIGYHKPLSQAMFANYRMVETIGTVLDPDIAGKSKWDAAQWEAYCRVVLLTFRDYLEKHSWEHSYALYRAKGYIEHAASDTYKLNELANVAWDDDVLSRLRVVVDFIDSATRLLDKKGTPNQLRLRVREGHDNHARKNFFDFLAEMIFEVIFAASAVKSPAEQCWWIQHNAVWGKLFNFDNLSGPAGKVIKFKARRLIYQEVADMNRFANFKGAKVLGFCLNVMGLADTNHSYDKDSRALHKAILSWTKKNYLWLHNYNPQVAAACLVDGLTYDADNQRLVKTYPVGGLRREASLVYLNLNAASAVEKAADPASA